MNHRNMIFPCHRETCRFGMSTGRIVDLLGEDKLISIKDFCLADRRDKFWPPAPTPLLPWLGLSWDRPTATWYHLCDLWNAISRAESAGGHQGPRSSSLFYQVNELDRFFVSPSSCHGGSHGWSTFKCRTVLTGWWASPIPCPSLPVCLIFISAFGFHAF